MFFSWNKFCGQQRKIRMLGFERKDYLIDEHMCRPVRDIKILCVQQIANSTDYVFWRSSLLVIKYCYWVRVPDWMRLNGKKHVDIIFTRCVNQLYWCGIQKYVPFMDESILTISMTTDIISSWGDTPVKITLLHKRKNKRA